MGKEKKIFVAATRQNDGKTMVSLGLLLNLKQMVPKTGFIKPVGQRYVEIDGHKVDEDSVLVGRVLGTDASRLKQMSPIAVAKGFTEKYLDQGRVEELIAIIEKSYARCAEGNDLVMIEGTGHAGVGSVFDLNNAAVARILNSKVVLVTIGGIGRPIDEVMLNKALFEKEGVELIGVIVNKVLPEKMDKIRTYVKRGLERKGIDLLGVIPYTELLSHPTMGQIKETLNLKLMHGEEFLGNRVGKAVVCAMSPHNALKYIHHGSLVITPGDREDLILAIIGSSMIKCEKESRIAGLILTGGLTPYKTIVELLRRTEVPVLKAEQDTYTITSRIHDLVVKIRDTDTEKIEMAARLMREYVDVDKIYSQAS